MPEFDQTPDENMNSLAQPITWLDVQHAWDSWNWRDTKC